MNNPELRALLMDTEMKVCVRTADRMAVALRLCLAMTMSYFRMIAGGYEEMLTKQRGLSAVHAGPENWAQTA